MSSAPKASSSPKPTTSGSALALYSRIDNPLDAINKLGTAFAKSGMFGCANVEQGQVLAMTCLSEGLTPLEFQRRYHIISGRPSLRADYMLSEFIEQGGEYLVIERSPDRASIELKIGKRKGVFEFTLQEAMAEEYVFTKPANEGKVPKVLADGKINDKACKDNWSTPRRRAQMLWNRVVSDAIRVICPTVNHGSYTPDELGGEDAEPETESVTVASSQSASQQPADQGEPIDAEFVVVKEERKSEQPAEKKEEPKPAEEKPADPPFKTEPMYDRNGLLVRLKTAKEALGLRPEQYKAILEKRNALSAKDLSDPELASLVAACETKLETIRKQQEAAAHVDETLGK